MSLWQPCPFLWPAIGTIIFCMRMFGYNTCFHTVLGDAVTGCTGSMTSVPPAFSWGRQIPHSARSWERDKNPHTDVFTLVVVHEIHMPCENMFQRRGDGSHLTATPRCLLPPASHRWRLLSLVQCALPVRHRRWNWQIQNVAIHLL
jgi:hypothetical protein